MTITPTSRPLSLLCLLGLYCKMVSCANPACVTVWLHNPLRGRCFLWETGLQCPWEGDRHHSWRRALRTASSSIRDSRTLHNKWRPSNSLMYTFLIRPLVCVLINVVPLGSTAGRVAERCCSCNNSPLTEMKAVIRPVASAALNGVCVCSFPPVRESI